MILFMLFNIHVQTLVPSLQMKTAACYYHRRQEITLIHSQLTLRCLAVLPPFRCIYHRGSEQKSSGFFPLPISPNLSYRSAGLKVHLFQLANDLFWAVWKISVSVSSGVEKFERWCWGECKINKPIREWWHDICRLCSHSARAGWLGAAVKR